MRFQRRRVRPCKKTSAGWHSAGSARVRPRGTWSASGRPWRTSSSSIWLRPLRRRWRSRSTRRCARGHRRMQRLRVQLGGEPGGAVAGGADPGGNVEALEVLRPTAQGPLAAWVTQDAAAACAAAGGAGGAAAGAADADGTECNAVVGGVGAHASGARCTEEATKELRPAAQHAALEALMPSAQASMAALAAEAAGAGVQPRAEALPTVDPTVSEGQAVHARDAQRHSDRGPHASAAGHLVQALYAKRRWGEGPHAGLVGHLLQGHCWRRGT